MLFNASSAKNTRRRVYMLTNDDAPCGASPAAKARALTRTQDLKDANVWIEPFFFAPPSPATFDLSPGSFWRELVGDARKNYKQPATSTGGDSVRRLRAAVAVAAALRSRCQLRTRRTRG